MRTLAALLFAWHVAAGAAGAQPARLAPLRVELGVGTSSLGWPGEPAQGSTRPELTAVVAAPVEVSTTTIYPLAGLQHDRVGLSSRDDYKERTSVTSLRLGLLLLASDPRRRLAVGLGLEARRPLFVRASVYSRGEMSLREWVETPTPEAFDQWAYYWVIRAGGGRGRVRLAFELTFDNERRSLPTMLVPKNPLHYLSIRATTSIALKP